MKRSIIKSTGRYVPDRHVANEELSELMETSNEWIVQRTGIEARYWVREGEDVGSADTFSGNQVFPSKSPEDKITYQKSSGGKSFSKPPYCTGQ